MKSNVISKLVLIFILLMMSFVTYAESTYVEHGGTISGIYEDLSEIKDKIDGTNRFLIRINSNVLVQLDLIQKSIDKINTQLIILNKKVNSECSANKQFKKVKVKKKIKRKPHINK